VGSKIKTSAGKSPILGSAPRPRTVTATVGVRESSVVRVITPSIEPACTGSNTISISAVWAMPISKGNADKTRNAELSEIAVSTRTGTLPRFSTLKRLTVGSPTLTSPKSIFSERTLNKGMRNVGSRNLRMRLLAASIKMRSPSPSISKCVGCPRSDRRPSVPSGPAPAIPVPAIVNTVSVSASTTRMRLLPVSPI